VQSVFFVLSIFLFTAAPAAAQVDLPQLNAADPISISAQAGNQWQLGVYDVWVLRGNCVIRQGNGSAQSRDAVVWIERAEPTERRQSKVIAYLEGDVKVLLDRGPGAPRLEDQTWLGRFFSSATVQVHAATTAGKPDTLPPIYWRGMEQRKPESAGNTQPNRVQPAQFTTPAPTLTPQPALTPVPAGSPMPVPAAPSAPSVVPGTIPATNGLPALPAGTRRISAYSRSNVPVQIEWKEIDPANNRYVGVISSGVNVVIDGLVVPGLGQLGKIDIVTDRLVIWTTGPQTPDLTSNTPEDERKPLELYMEGNIVFRQGERTIYADRMYYDVPNHVGTVLNADVQTPLPGYQGLIRLHAEVLQQTAADRYFGQNAFFTSSRMGVPGYRVQAGDVYFEDIQQPVIDPKTGQPVIDPSTGQPAVEPHRLATASNDLVFIGPVPVFYWPVLATDLSDPAYYIRRAQLNQDQVYGTQVRTHWNGYELLGIRDKPKGTDFDVAFDYLSLRGFGYGGSFTYDREGMFDIPGHVAGLADFWAIQDRGTDNLGQGRSAVPPEASYRYRLFGQHRELLPYDLQLSAELGLISDRNFVEEYFKSEWDELKDENTGLELKQYNANRSWSVTADYRVNDFFTQTNWLPRADHTWLGQSLFNDVFVWHEHSSAAYAQFRQTTVPENATPFPSPPLPVGAAGPFNYLPWEQFQTQGARFSTRQELDWPIQLGPVKVVPFALGDATYWGEDQTGNSLTRLMWEAGVRANLPMWSVDPTYNSDLLNVHGIAHKVNFKAEFSVAQSNQNLQDLPLYDPLDDDSVEAFRRRFMTTTFGVPSMITVPPGAPPGKILIPPQFDERLYALRTGLQDWVTSPSAEIAGDMTAFRLGVEQKWQTKRGRADDPHIIDWITLDTNVTLFPNPSRDDFGQSLGLLDYNFRWHVGDRLTLVSDAIFDFFDQGQKIVSIGGFLTRPPRGSLYAGFQVLEGPINSKILSATYTYWMSPKWLSSMGASIDLGSQGNLGEQFTVTRVGESFLISGGFNVDNTRNSVGASLSIEPRFLPKTRLGNVAGAQIPPAGAFGLE
jgi:hypothetical protein